jgi:hypothetical protein
MPPEIAAIRLSPILQARKLVSDPHLLRAIRLDSAAIVKKAGKPRISIPPPWRYVFALGLLILAWGTPTARAQTNTGTTVIRASDSGWYASYNGAGYFSEGSHGSSNKNYSVGARGQYVDDDPSSYYEARDYFVFDLSGITGPIVSATLKLQDGCPHCRSSGPPWMFSLFDVSTPIPDLESSWWSRADIFNDLGSGTVLGVRIATNADYGGGVP